VADPAESRTF